MFAFACTSELSRPAASALSADLVPSPSRVAAFTLSRLATNVGLVVGLALGAFLAERSFDLLFVGDAATSIAFGATRGMGSWPDRCSAPSFYSASPQILWWACGGLGVLAAGLALSARRFPVPGSSGNSSKTS